MITVTTSLWRWTGGQGSWHFLTIAEEDAGELRAEAFAAARGFGSVKVAATIDGIEWRTSVFPQKSGGYILPVKADVRRRAGLATGDEVIVRLDIV